MGVSLLQRLTKWLGFTRRSDPEREDWDQAWGEVQPREATVPLRGFVTPRDLSSWGPVVGATVSLPPPEFKDRVSPENETCPLCGASTTGGERHSALLSPTFRNGLGYSAPVWVHVSCYDRCGPSSKRVIPW